MTQHPIASATADWLDDLLVDPNTGEVIEFTDTPPEAVVTDLAPNIDAKIDGYAAAIRRWEANAEVCKQEEQRYAVRRKIWENKAKRLKEWISYVMLTTNRQKVATPTTTAQIVPNGGKPGIDLHGDLAEIPTEYLKIETKPDMEKIRAALERGESLPFARLLDRGSHLRIK